MKLSEIKFDCRYYQGTKPCHKALECKGCPYYAPMGSRILIIKLGAMGDVLRTTPLLPGLKKKYPQSHITWLTNLASRELLFNNSLIDRLLIFEFADILPLIAEEFDTLINLDKEPKALAVANLVKAREKLGFAVTPHGTLTVFNKESEYALMLGLSDELKFKINQKTYQEIIFEMVGLKYSGEEYVLKLSERAEHSAESFREKHGLENYAQIIGIHTGSGSAFRTKEWTIAGWTGLITALQEMPDSGIVLMGGEAEYTFNQRLMHSLGARAQQIIDSGCKNPLEDFIGILSCCDLVVGLDSLAIHIAIALRKYVVAIFGPTCPQEIDLYGRGKKVIADMECAPCYRQECDISPRCMEKLSGDAVARAVKELISEAMAIRPTARK